MFKQVTALRAIEDTLSTGTKIYVVACHDQDNQLAYVVTLQDGIEQLQFGISHEAFYTMTNMVYTLVDELEDAFHDNY